MASSTSVDRHLKPASRTPARSCDHNARSPAVLDWIAVPLHLPHRHSLLVVCPSPQPVTNWRLPWPDCDDSERMRARNRFQVGRLDVSTSRRRPPSRSDGRASISVWCRQQPDTASETKSENESVCQKNGEQVAPSKRYCLLTTPGLISVRRLAHRFLAHFMLYLRRPNRLPTFQDSVEALRLRLLQLKQRRLTPRIFLGRSK